MPYSPRRKFLSTLLAAPLTLLPTITYAADTASLTSSQAVVAPLQPVAIQVSAPGYTGPAAIVLFDARKRYAGTVEGRVEQGSGTLTAFPRGALGPQWAALFLSGQQAAVNPTLFQLEANTTIQTGVERFDAFCPAMQKLFSQAVVDYKIGARQVRGYRSPDSDLLWLRDHIYQQRAVRYFDANLRIALDAFRDAQFADGSFPDFLDRPEYQVVGQRTPVEADVEYLYVQGIYELWQATGDDGWVKSHLGAMRRAIAYTLTSPLRWDAEHGLVKRPYTIDTWDFEVGPTTTDPHTGNPAPRHWIDNQTNWGIFHGDNTGMAHSLQLLSQIENRVGDPNIGKQWHDQADAIMKNLNAIAWNGSFYRHHVAFQKVDIPGVDPEQQLSLSNAIALNRDVLTPEQANAILTEYGRRADQDVARYAAGRADGAFAGWYSIDPPFPQGSVGLAGRSGEIPGSYVNGGIMPLVGGELARGAFRYGRNDYGFATLELYWLKMLSHGRTFLWYHRNGAEGVGSNDTIPTDGWSAGRMLIALLEGAAGVIDQGLAMRNIQLSPRWGATHDVRNAYVVVRYAAGDGYSAYHWQQGDRSISLDATGSAELTQIALPLPEGAGVGKKSHLAVLLNGAATPYTLDERAEGRYILIDSPDTVIQISVTW